MLIPNDKKKLFIAVHHALQYRIKKSVFLFTKPSIIFTYKKEAYCVSDALLKLESGLISVEVCHLTFWLKLFFFTDSSVLEFAS